MNDTTYLNNGETEFDVNTDIQQIGITNEKLVKLRGNTELSNLFTAFAEAQKDAILRVMSAQDEEEQNAIAAGIARDVNSLHKSFSGGPKCPPGTKLNPETGFCDPV